MAAHTYWRVVQVAGYADGDLELAGFHLYAGGDRVDAGAVLSCSFAPSEGVLANLQDDTDSAVRWPLESIAQPGFAMQWALAAPAEVDGFTVRAAGSKDRFLARFQLQWADVPGVWSVQSEYDRLVWPGEAQTLSGISATTSGDPHWGSVSLLLRVPVGGAAPVDEKGRHVPVLSGSVAVDPAVTYNGRPTLSFTGGTVFLADSPDWYFDSIPFTVEAKVRFSAAALGARVFVCGQDKAGGGDSTIAFSKGTDDKLRAVMVTDTGSYSITTTWSATSGVWYHLEMCRDAGTLYFLVDKTLIAAIPVSGAFFDRAPQFAVGSLGEYTGAYGGSFGTMMVGWVGEFRLTRNLARHTASYTSSEEEFESAPVGDGPITEPPPRRVRHLGTLEKVLGTELYLAPVSAVALPAMQHGPDLEFGGRGTITGTVNKKDAPANMPLRRQVFALRETDRQVAAMTWSDMLTGSYAFVGISERYTYTVLAHDHTGAQNAVVASGIVPSVA